MLLDTKLPVRYIFRRILPDILRVLLISFFFEALKIYFGEYLPPIPLQLAAILGSSISLLLAFKISQSYDRWWEARRLWGAIVNDSRTLVFQVRSFVAEEVLQRPAPDNPLLAVAHRQMAWCYSLGQALRGRDALAGLERFLPADELTYARSQTNKPLALLSLHNHQVRTLRQDGAINTLEHLQLDSTLVRLIDSMGACERIKNTVFPTSYRLLVYFLIYLFLATLSLGLVETIGWWEVPVLLAIACSFFLLERTARYLQDPFNDKPTDTPVTAIARTVEINLKQLLEQDNVPKPLVADKFYLM